ncbi:MAG: Stp1/IreP family PP2C-type Ser/Thr phosphatase [Parachlamydiaceae bacterium]|nr:Stp1/IreP family PP2C-type Ser/Thr phosphatase [Parachlamydiaceae bacterium]
MAYKITAVGLSDRGLVRATNEDVWGEVPDLHLYVLADGMGGHQAGEVAAREAVNGICRLAKKIKKSITLYEARDAFDTIIKQVNTSIYQLSKSDEHLKGMGTTICCMQFRDKSAVYGHVGDSRIYLLRKQKLELLTADHSLMRELMDLGQLSESQAGDFLYKNILTKAIGTEPNVDPSVYTCEVESGDTFLLCSDGLSDPLSEEDIQTIINNAPSLEEAVRVLIAHAKYRGGYDNITAVLIQCHEA